MSSCESSVHGLSSTLYIGDEVWAWPDTGLLEAMVTGPVKRRDSKLLIISTAAAQLDSPLGRMRARALAQPSTKRTGAVVEAAGDPHWLEWSVPDEAELDDLRAVKAANPAPWITVADSASAPPCPRPRSRSSTPAAGASVRARGWPAGAWQACVGAPTFTDGEPVWVGVDVGGERSASAVAWVNAGLHVGVGIYHGDGGVLDCVEQVRDLAQQYAVREVVFDPWRFGQAAQELERERIPSCSSRRPTFA